MNKVGMAVAAAIVSVGAALPVQAEISDHVTFSGFGTFGVVATDSNEAQFGRDRQLGGATKNIDTQVDSNLGLQLALRANDWLSATVQGLAMTRGYDGTKLELEWAFVKAQPIDGLALRVGRMAVPTFVVSDSRNIGYANTWLRAPNEVYGLAMMPRVDGVDLSYSREVGAVTLSGTLLAGDATINALGTDYDANKVRGGNLQVEAGPVTFRIGKVIADTYVDATFPEERYSFSGVGVTVNHGNVIAQAEYVQRRGEYYYNLVSANGWYGMGGYRFGALTPYAIVSSTKPKVSADHVPMHLAVPRISERQESVALGLRWDATDFAAVKFQVERVDTHGTPGISFSRDDVPVVAAQFAVPVTKPVNVISATVDFVF